jgi:predicted nucleic acid-binding protein
MRLALDTNVLIYAIEGNSEQADLAEALLKALDSEHEGFISELAFLELLSNPRLSEAAAQDLYLTIQQLSFEAVPIDRAVLLESARLRRLHTIKTPDAIHLATALQQKVDYFVTNDQELLRHPIPGIKLAALKDINKTILNCPS